jgi:hypothetical protein
MESMLPFQPSIGQATNTRIDSACKHIQQCRVATDEMLKFVGDDNEELRRQKYRYCVHKDEFAVGLARPWDPNRVTKRTKNQAYPRIISNLGTLNDNDQGRVALNMIRFMNHFARTLQEKQKIVSFFQKDQFMESSYIGQDDAEVRLRGNECFTQKQDGSMGTKDCMNMMWDVVPMGFANTLGYAHPNVGDTMCSIMIGGLRTVMNGDFEIFSGDLVQFYWPFEKDDFTPDGRRKPYVNIWNDNGDVCNWDPSKSPTGANEMWDLPQDAMVRQANYSLTYGAKPAGEKLVAYIKPYFHDDDHPRLMDWTRVFGRAICSARPHEMVDVHIARQSV